MDEFDSVKLALFYIWCSKNVQISLPLIFVLFQFGEGWESHVGLFSRRGTREEKEEGRGEGGGVEDWNEERGRKG